MARASGQPPASGNDAIDKIPSPGEIIAAKYEVERVVGTGGMGVVVAARHIQLGQVVAIKFMRGPAATDSAAVGRFQREARAAAALSSEHVAKVFDVGTLETGVPYIVLEYLAGIDLADMLRRDGPMPVSVVLFAVLQACEAIAEAHSLGIVHRDLKPSNLFATQRKDGTLLVKVLDFGISKATPFNAPSSSENLTASGYIMGSPAYMSPEQVRSAKAADARSDIWSLGVILYELLTGIAPFAGETLGDTFARIVGETPESVDRRRSGIPAGLARVVARCLERDIARRIQSVAELASSLAPYAAPEAALSIERVLRLSNISGATVAAGATIAAPGTMSAFPLPSWDAAKPSRPDEHIETGPRWLRWDTGQGRPSRAPRASWTLAILVAVGVTLAASLGVYALRLPTRDRLDPSAEGHAPVALPTAVAPAEKAPAVNAPIAVTPGAPGGEALVGPDAASPSPHPPQPAARDRSGVRHFVVPGHPTAGPTNNPSIDDLLEHRQ